MPSQPTIELTQIALQNAEQDSRWCCEFHGAFLEAAQAIDGDVNTMSHTLMGRGHWWKAEFTEGYKNVSEVRITNRADCCGDRLSGTEVWISGQKCGQITGTTTNGTVYTVACEDADGNAATLSGNEVTIKQDTTYTALQLAEVQVWGNDNCLHDERLNALGPSKCSTAMDCAGARTCSRWGWCSGESQCSGVTDQDIRAMYNTSVYLEAF
jgi:hypothetical protein